MDSNIILQPAIVSAAKTKRNILDEIDKFLMALQKTIETATTEGKNEILLHTYPYGSISEKMRKGGRPTPLESSIIEALDVAGYTYTSMQDEIGDNKDAFNPYSYSLEISW